MEVDKLTAEEIFSLKAQYALGTKHMKYYHDTMKYFQFPERRLKCFDTVHYETRLPEIEEALKKLGVI